MEDLEISAYQSLFSFVSHAKLVSNKWKASTLNFWISLIFSRTIETYEDNAK